MKTILALIGIMAITSFSVKSAQSPHRTEVSSKIETGHQSVDANFTLSAMKEFALLNFEIKNTSGVFAAIKNENTISVSIEKPFYFERQDGFRQVNVTDNRISVTKKAKNVTKNAITVRQGSKILNIDPGRNC